ncbi:hypothetical protein [Bradyrhizobium diazoefficiens]|uniref:hypothetical protein n=1 Tax=Bradyrhizobium diazoefficiens TaxID=1355477 RepID=UPI0027145D8D|nr:hypothetical protein [Bradyrhizobium diazoefficiens]WLB40269.1 hypothetical protein QIH78_10910 [Bradyrhizobium diazoefficiens]WLC14757.1 hypothetical protein QIH76_32140 [Bradyrhizobium diazoefficiens]
MAKKNDFNLYLGLPNKEFAQQLGQLTVAWAALEFAVFRLFEVMTGLPVPMARSIYYSARTTAARLELVRSVAVIVLRKRQPKKMFRPHMLGDALALQKRVLQHLGDIGRIAGDRNKFVHDPWAGQYPSRRLYQLRLGGKEIYGHYEPVRLRDVKRLTTFIEGKAVALGKLHNVLAPKMPPLHSILELQHELLLVPKKAAPTQQKKKRTRTK